jgi:hypothetical protein
LETRIFRLGGTCLKEICYWAFNKAPHLLTLPITKTISPSVFNLLQNPVSPGVTYNSVHHISYITRFLTWNIVIDIKGTNVPTVLSSCDFWVRLSEKNVLAGITARSWVLLEVPPVEQMRKNFLTFYGTRKFSTALTRAFHLSPSWARPILFTPLQAISPS